MLKAATEEELQAYLPQALLTWALNQCKGAGQQHIVFFVEEGEGIRPQSFTCVGEYLLFTKEIRRDAHCV